MVIRIHIAQQHWNGIDRIHDNIDLAVVEQVAKCGAAGRSHNRQSGSFDGGHQFKLPGFQVMEQQRALRIRRAPALAVDFWIDMAIHNEQILPPVVVVIEETVAKSDERKSRRTQLRF